MVASVDGNSHAFETKLSKIPELKEYSVSFGGGFTGYLGSAVVVKRADHPVLALLSEHQNMGLLHKADLGSFEGQINPKRNRKQFISDTCILLTPIATASKQSATSADHLIDLVHHRRKVELLGEAFVWFKTSKGIDFDRLGGFNPFIMILSIISRQL